MSQSTVCNSLIQDAVAGSSLFRHSSLWFPVVLISLRLDITGFRSSVKQNWTSLVDIPTLFHPWICPANQVRRPKNTVGRLKVHCSWFKTPENKTFLMMILDNAIWQIRGRTYLDWLSEHVRLIWNNLVVHYWFWNLRNSLVLKRATQIHFPWLPINTLTVLCTDYLDSHLHRRHLHLMNKKKWWVSQFSVITLPFINQHHEMCTRHHKLICTRVREQTTNV